MNLFLILNNITLVFIISIFLVDDFSYYFIRSFCLQSFQHFMLISTNQLSYSYDILWLLDNNEKEASNPRNSQCLVVLIQYRKVRSDLQKAMKKLFFCVWLPFEINIWIKGRAIIREKWASKRQIAHWQKVLRNEWKKQEE